MSPLSDGSYSVENNRYRQSLSPNRSYDPPEDEDRIISRNVALNERQDDA
jgi:hypothetical protein